MGLFQWLATKSMKGALLLQMNPMQKAPPSGILKTFINESVSAAVQKGLLEQEEDGDVPDFHLAVTAACIGLAASRLPVVQEYINLVSSEAPQPFTHAQQTFVSDTAGKIFFLKHELGYKRLTTE